MEGVCSSARWVALEEGKGASGLEVVGTGAVAENSRGHSRTVHVSRGVAGIVGNPGVKVGFGGGEVVGENMAASVELGEAEVATGIAELAEVQGRGEHKVGAGRRLVVGIGNTAVRGDGEEAGVLVVDAGVGTSVGDAGVAAAASRIGYHHNRSSHTKRTVQ